MTARRFARKEEYMGFISGFNDEAGKINTNAGQYRVM